MREQYERLPYPPRDPEHEKRMLHPTCAEHLDQLNFHCFGGSQDFKDAFRVLVAGGGTGDASVFLGEQLRATDAKITHLDVSGASLLVARERAAVRGLTNIEFVHGSLLDLRPASSGPFDYINCSGVLHHLHDPDAGMRALASVLKPTGVIGAMVYGLYGRTGVYQMQELMRRVNGVDRSMREQLENCKSMLASLPASNWFRRQREELVDLKAGDAGIYDLLLHSRDRAYTVDGVYDLAAAAGLRIFTFLKLNGGGQVDYNPDRHIKDPCLRETIASMSVRERQALAELISGDEIKHTFYCGRAQVEAPSFADEAMVPFLSLHFGARGDAHAALGAMIERQKKPEVVFDYAGREVRIKRTPNLPALFALIDGTRSIAEIVLAASSHATTRRERLLEEFGSLYVSMKNCDLMLLRTRQGHRPTPLVELQRRVVLRYIDRY